MFGLKWIVPIAALVLMTGISAFAKEHAPEAPQPKGKVTGIVTDVQGNPAVEIKVVLKTIVAPAAKKESASSSPMVHDGSEPVIVAHVKTDANGSFTLEAPAGTYTLTANGKDKGESSAQVTITVDQTATQNLTLVPPAEKKAK